MSAQREQAAAVFCLAVARSIAPRARLTVSAWADRYRVLSSKASAEPGPWRTARNPMLAEIMDCLSATSPVREVWLKKCAQGGGTEVGLNWIGYTLAHHPGPMLIVLPTLNVRKKWNRQRLRPLFTETPALTEILGQAERDGAKSEELRDYPGGFLVLAGANSPASLASMPIRDVICDEVDRFPWEVGVEGDPLALIEQRQSTFRRRKILFIASPTLAGSSRIDQGYQASDQRVYLVPCPHCARDLVLHWKQLKWNRAATEVWYVCEHCGAMIRERDKTAMIAAGHWQAQRPEAPANVRGYHLGGLYTPVGLGYTWLEIVHKWLAALDDRTKLIAFTNTILGECWEDRSAEIAPYRLEERAEPYPLRHAPAEVLLATAGVDTQDDRLALQILGWGRGGVCYVLDWIELPGNPEDPALWMQLTDILLRPIARGGKQDADIRIAATAVDTGGHHTQAVYRYVRERAAPRLMAIKGANRPGRPALSSRPQPVDVSAGGRMIKAGVKLWTIGTDTAKHALFGRLAADADLPSEKRAIRFSQDLTEEYYRQLTAERFNPRRNRFELHRARRNEALDTWVYGYAAAQHPELRGERMQARDWERLAAQLESAGPVGERAAQPEARMPAPARKRARSGLGREDWNL